MDPRSGAGPSQPRGTCHRLRVQEQRSPVFGLAVAFTGFAVLLGTAVVASRAEGRATATSSAAETPDAAPEVPSLLVVRNGKPLQLAGAREKPALLHLWATWCGPCRDELPLVLDYGRSGAVDVIALSVDDEWASVQQYFGAAIPPEVAWDQRIVVERALNVESLPTTFLIDSAGRVRGSWVGAKDWRSPSLRASIEQLSRRADRD